MFRYSTLADPTGRPAHDASELLAAAERCSTWDEVTLAPEVGDYPRANVSWHEGHGLVVHCFENVES